MIPTILFISAIIISVTPFVLLDRRWERLFRLFWIVNSTLFVLFVLVLEFVVFKEFLSKSPPFIEVGFVVLPVLGGVFSLTLLIKRFISRND